MALKISKKKAVKTKRPKNPVCAILWMDASYVTTKEFPKELPLPQLTIGFIISASEKFINIATNVKYDSATGRLWPIDGFVIPRKVEMKFIRLVNLNGKI